MATIPPSTPPTPATPKKRTFTIQELKAVHDALVAGPTTKNNKSLIDRVMDVINDPGVTVPPIS